MNRAMMAGLGILLVALVIGCGDTSRTPPQADPPGPDDQLMQDWFTTANKVLDLSNVPGERAAREREELDQYGRELRKVFDSWPKEKQDAMNAKYKREKDRLNARLLKALMPPP